MGKPSGKKKTAISSKSGEAFSKPVKPTKAFDEDTAVFIAMSQELRDEGNRLYQKRDHEGAMLKYEKALKLLPKNHIDVAYLRSNMAACYMQLGLGEYPRAINECNLALEVSPKYSKALLRRAKCYESLNRLDLALRDVNYVLSMEPSNVTALEIADSVNNAMIEKGILVEDKEILSEKVEKEIVSVKVEKEEIVSEKFETPVKEKAEISKNDNSSSQKKSSKERSGKKKRSTKVDGKKSKVKVVVEEKLNKTKDKEVVLKKKTIEEEEEEEQQKEITKSVKEEHVSVTRKVKLVLGEDIRWAHLPVNCSIKLVRDIVMDRFPNLRGALVKYKDQEGDLVTITTNSELRMVEASSGHQGSLRLYIADVHSEQEPAYEGLEGEVLEKVNRNSKVSETVDKGSICVEDWIVQFARLFKNQVGFETDSYLDLHEIGMKLYSEAMEETITTEDSQQLFEIASEKFQEMTSLALFNWGNVHMSRVRKQVFIPDDNNSKDVILEKVKTAYTWALKEYAKAGSRYEEALKIKNDFYEALLALGQQQFEQAKLSWYYAVATNADGIEDGPTEEILMLYNKAEDSMERGMQIWEEMEERRLNGISNSENYKVLLQKMGLEGVFKEVGSDEALEYGSNMRSQIYLLWGTLLYERSVVEYKLQLPTWEECLEVAVEKFQLAGASATDRAVIIKNHCSNATSLEGFKIDEIVHAWNEMYDASKWQIGVPAFRLEPLFRRKVPKLHSVLEHI